MAMDDEMQTFSPRIITNGDRIRAMSDEELAKWMKERYVCDRQKHGCPPRTRCYECKLNFMKKEAEP